MVYRYTDETNTYISDGVMIIPAVAGNRFFDAIAASGQSIEPYAAPPASGVDVDRERDRRLQKFTFNGVEYDFDMLSRGRIDKARGSALAAMISGAEANDLRWADDNNDFCWITADNSFVTMDAPTTLAFGNAAAAWESLHIVAARNIKNMSPIPTDYTSNSYWPAG